MFGFASACRPARAGGERQSLLGGGPALVDLADCAINLGQPQQRFRVLAMRQGYFAFSARYRELPVPQENAAFSLSSATIIEPNHTYRSVVFDGKGPQDSQGRLRKCRSVSGVVQRTPDTGNLHLYAGQLCLPILVRGILFQDLLNPGCLLLRELARHEQIRRRSPGASASAGSPRSNS